MKFTRSQSTKTTEWAVCAKCGERVVRTALDIHAQDFCPHRADPITSGKGTESQASSLPMETCPVCSYMVQKSFLAAHLLKCPLRRPQIAVKKPKKPKKRIPKRLKGRGIQITRDVPSVGPYTFVSNTRPLQGGSPGSGKRG